MVTIASIHRSAHRVNHQAVLHGLLLDACVQFVRGVKRGLARAVLHQFDAPEQATTANVADVRMLGPALLQLGIQGVPARLHLCQQAVAFNHLLNRQ